MPSAEEAVRSTITAYTELGIKYQQAFTSVPAQVRSLEWIISQLPPQSNVVDVGCGTGKPAAAMLADAGHRVLGVDLTPAMVEIARHQVPNARFEVADSRVWSPDNAGDLDGVVAYFSFLAGVSQLDIRDFFRRAHNWLRPGGFFVFGTVPVEGENVQLRWMGKDVIVSSLSGEETVASIKAVGFEVVKQESEMYMPTAKEAGIREEDVWEEPQLFVHARKSDIDNHLKSLVHDIKYNDVLPQLPPRKEATNEGIQINLW